MSDKGLWTSLKVTDIVKVIDKIIVTVIKEFITSHWWNRQRSLAVNHTGDWKVVEILQGHQRSCKVKWRSLGVSEKNGKSSTRL